MKRRAFTACLLPLALAAAAFPAWAGRRPVVEVWKSPTCGCCQDWITHLRSNGFEAKVHDDGNTDARARLHMPLAYGACHTGQVDGYAIEGHVPAREIHRLLQEKPQAAIGLAVPAMPLGSPGMDGPAFDNLKHPYDVLLVRRDGGTSVYQSYR